MTPDRHGSAVVEFPNDLEIVITREFDAPIALVFDVLTKPEHVSKWGATPPDQMKECSIDLRVGGNYYSCFVTEDGTECSFHGTYLEVEPPFRTVETWVFDGWPNAEAVETMQLHETDGVTTLTMRLAFRDKAGRDHMTKFDGQQDSLDGMEEILRSLLGSTGTSPSSPRTGV
ncbi:MAG TPA: SRPBCC domain-containing protein [Streptosporangiaceae bacterium]